jgi:hypothetical protein
MTDGTQAGKQRIQIKITNVETGEEQVSSDTVVLPGFCSHCCCTTTILDVRPPPGPGPRPQAR